jgi:hypothetical protein
MPRGPRAFATAALAATVALASGCATVDPFSQPPIAQHLARADGVGDCARRLQALDGAARTADARDAQETLVPGFPYLRVDRLSQALAPPAADEARWQAWRARLAANDRLARRHELRNSLPGDSTPAAQDLDGCRQALLDADDDHAARGALRVAAQVPDDYSTALRALGLYPLTQLAFAAGIRGWHEETRRVFALPLAELPVHGRLRVYALAPPETAAPADAAATPAAAATALVRDRLGVPQVPPLAALLQRHAPVIEVDDTGVHDRIGPLVIGPTTGRGGWAPPPVEPAAASATGSAATAPLHPRVDLTQPPVAYARLAFGELGGVLRAQLVYTFWFPARPRDHALDLLGGELDAIVWRVTLHDEGQALVYDSIHACGCYHLFFATDRVRARASPPPRQGLFDEGLFMPQPPLPALLHGERIALRVATRTHYLQRVGVAAAVPADALRYQIRDEDSLRSLTVIGGDAAGPVSRSVYDSAGLVPGSERLERFFFWPMGIASAGQMRQWGRHATAFVGRRHFDDPGLLDRYFELPADSGAPP